MTYHQALQKIIREFENQLRADGFDPPFIDEEDRKYIKIIFDAGVEYGKKLHVSDDPSPDPPLVA
jgi:hypothetical protein